MATSAWDWKARDGRRGGLLYESGNWGDFLKAVWLTEVMQWKTALIGGVNYFDPFAGAVAYPIGRKIKFRFEQAALQSLDYFKGLFIDKNVWPSSASAALYLTSGKAAVYDADQSRREGWKDIPDVTVLDGESGWSLLAERPDDPEGIWLVDPYDFLAEWRDQLPIVTDKARTTTTLVYLYNRSAKSEEAFREYRAFRNAVIDEWGDAPCRYGRIAADAFLPRAHHEVWLFPGRADCERDGFRTMLAALETGTQELATALGRNGAFDSL